MRNKLTIFFIFICCSWISPLRISVAENLASIPYTINTVEDKNEEIHSSFLKNNTRLETINNKTNEMIEISKNDNNKNKIKLANETEKEEGFFWEMKQKIYNFYNYAIGPLNYNFYANQEARNFSIIIFFLIGIFVVLSIKNRLQKLAQEKLDAKSRLAKLPKENKQQTSNFFFSDEESSVKSQMRNTWENESIDSMKIIFKANLEEDSANNDMDKLLAELDDEEAFLEPINLDRLGEEIVQEK